PRSDGRSKRKRKPIVVWKRAGKLIRRERERIGPGLRPKSEPLSISPGRKRNLKRESRRKKSGPGPYPTPRLRYAPGRKLKEKARKPEPGFARPKNGANWLRRNYNKRPRPGLWLSAGPTRLKRNSPTAWMPVTMPMRRGPKLKPRREKKPRRGPQRSRDASRSRRCRRTPSPWRMANIGREPKPNSPERRPRPGPERRYSPGMKPRREGL